MKTSKKTPSVKMVTSSGSKRKDQPEKTSEKNKKKMRMYGEEDEEGNNKEVSKLLQSLKEQFDGVIEVFSSFKEEKWHKNLVLRRDLIGLLLKDQLEGIDRTTLPSRAELKPLLLQIDSVEERQRDYVQQKFNDLNACLQNAIKQSEVVPAAPAPSTYCFSSHYKRAQSNSQLAVRDGRMGTAPLALELLHPSFRIFTYWSSINPYPLPGSPEIDERKIDDKSFIKAYQAANVLLHSMPQFYSSHDDRLGDFHKALVLVFPENEEFEWCMNAPADQGLSSTNVSYRVDIVYRFKKTKIPLIFVEVKLELGEGGNPFWQNHRLYQSYTDNNPKSRFNGAPVFFIQLCGMNFLQYDFNSS
jgi:hypothetical protein